MCCCWMKYCVDVNYIRLIDGGVEFNYVFTDFLLDGFVHFDRELLESATKIVD